MTFTGWPDGGRRLSRPWLGDPVRDDLVANADNTVGYVPPAVAGWGRSPQPSAGVLWSRVLDPQAADGSNFNINTVCWSPELRLFVAGCNVSPTFHGYSPDGRNWFRGSGGTTCYSICWSRELSLFVSSYAGRMGYSSNGINFTTNNYSGSDWTSICWSPQLGIFVTVAPQTAAASQVMTSTDGINWTGATAAAANQWRSVCWSPQLGIFVATARSGTGNRVMTSPDGVNWTAQVSPADISWDSVCWSPDLGLFCAVANTGSGNNRVMTSPDGITWTLGSIGVAVNSWFYVAWLSGLGLFIATANAGTRNRIATSEDGFTWISRPAPDLNYRGVDYAPELQTAVAVATNPDVGICISQ